MKRTRVNANVRAAVIRRDRVCFLYRLDPMHVCRGPYGVQHAPDAAHSLTVEHVKDHLMMGVRAPSDAAHMVAMCYAGNVGVPSKEQRAAMREYLAKVTR